jgi:hypothetical protein
MTRTSKYFAVRKPRNGRVKIAGTWYKPSDQFMDHEGQLDGHWLLFGRYGDSADYISLCGELLDDSGELCVQGCDEVKGTYPWKWWYDENSSK